MCFVGVLERLSRMLMSGQVILLSVLTGSAVGVRGGIVQFGCSLMILVMRSVVIAGGHIQRLSICADLLWASFANL